MELFSYVFLLLPLFTLIFLFINRSSRRRRNSPEIGFKSYPIVGSLPGLLKNRHRFLDWSTEILARSPTQTAVFRRPGKIQIVMTANPANLECMLKTKFENFPKGERLITHLEDLLGRGIFNSDGEMWWKQRKTASYEFSTRSLRDFVLSNVTVEITTRLVPMLAEAAKAMKVLDFQDVLERFAFDNICKLAFNVDPACLGDEATATGDEFMRAFDTATALISQRFMSLSPHGWKLKRKLNLGSERLLRDSIRTVHKFAEDIVRTRVEAKSGDKNEDLLSRFIKIDDMSSRDLLRDIVISFMLAGRDTSSSALSWFFWLLSLHPEVEQNIIGELNSIRARTGKKTGETYGFEDLKQMTYLHAAITESMRLYPPVHVDTLCCLKDTVLPDGTFVGGGWGISYNAYAMGRMESIWGRDCGSFRPERWIEEGVFRPESPFRFPVFHAGPRACLGKEMAYIQMKSIVASVLERFVIDVPKKEEHPEFLMSVTLRIKGGLNVKVRERS